MRRALLVVQVALASFTTAAAAAPGRTARLTYSRGADAADCPDVEVIRAGVAARLGYEPFDDRGELLVSASVSRTGRVLEARIQIGGASGSAAAERETLQVQALVAWSASSRRARSLRAFTAVSRAASSAR